MAGTALIVGATGIIGGNLAKELLAGGWIVYGLSRDPKDTGSGLRPIASNLLDAESVKKALADVAPSHVFITTWTRRATEAENIEVNSAMVRNVLDALSPKRSVKHVALVTGLKHYLGPFDQYVTGGFLPDTPLREEQPRLSLPNFYYAQEDEVYAAAKRDGFTWSVHRPHTVIGKAIGNAMNMGSTLAVYASICKEINRPFHFPGSEQQWNGLSDVTDARILAKQLLWAATSDAARNEAFNITNGDTFRWKWLWPRLAKWFDVEWVGFDGKIHPLEAEMANDGPTWAAMAEKYNLIEPDIKRVSSAWHTDLDLGRPIEVMTDMGKSRKLGFMAFQSTEDTFFDLFEDMRKNRIIP
jgi:nucleoside-diphosphate-sugar epimerase